MSTVVSREFGSFEHYNYHLFTDFAKSGIHFTCKNGKNVKYFHLKSVYIKVGKFIYFPKLINKIVKKIFWSRVEKWTKITKKNILEKKKEYMIMASKELVRSPICKAKTVLSDYEQRIYGCFDCDGNREKLGECIDNKNRALNVVVVQIVSSLEIAELTKNRKK